MTGYHADVRSKIASYESHLEPKAPKAPPTR